MQPVSLTLIAEKHLPDYSSASNIVFYNDHFYIMGDDASHLLVLDRQYNYSRTIRIFNRNEKRIPKAEKADLEASAIINYEGSPHLFLCGSGSTALRETVILFSLETETISSFSVSAFFDKIKTTWTALNIEGCTAYKDRMILSNRANKASKENQLIITGQHFFDEPDSSFIILPVKINADTVIGISSIEYLETTDRLVFTATTEDTYSGYDDGLIGDSYLGFIDHFSTKENNSFVSPDLLINLSEKLPQLKQQKIEGCCTEEKEGHQMIFHLVSDNDNGESSIFQIEMS